jgi:hypothetical protein
MLTEAMPADTIPIADFSNGEFVTIRPFPHVTQTSVMPVVAFRGSEIRPLGTCFAISNHGLVMTAKHVIDDALRITGWSADSPSVETDGWWVGAVYVANPEPGDDVPDLVGGILSANKVHINANIDVGVMHLNLPVRTKDDKPIRMPALRIAPGIPSLGAYCFAIGYHAMKCDVAVDASLTHDVSQSYSGTRGKITALHFPRRDASLLKFPCFETDSRFDPGMSGAPILDQHGGAIGVVCSSFGEMPDGHLSYGSLIGPALFLEIDTPSGKAFLYDFITGGSVSTDSSIERIKVTRANRRMEIDFGVSPKFVGELSPQA